MLVFLSWSGLRSKAVASYLQTWLADLNNYVEPWISTDIEKGAKWANELSDKLGQSRAGIICLTRQSLRSPWIYFEAGAIGNAKDTLVCNLLIDLPAASVIYPLAQFQHTITTREDIFKLVQSINAAAFRSNEGGLKESALNRAFDIHWPRLHDELERIKQAKFSDEQTEIQPATPAMDIMMELIGVVLLDAPVAGLAIEEILGRVFQKMGQKSMPPEAMLALIANDFRSRFIKDLTNRGYVNSRNDRYALTDKGRAYFSRTAMQNAELQRKMVSALAANEIEEVPREGSPDMKLLKIIHDMPFEILFRGEMYQPISYFPVDAIKEKCDKTEFDVALERLRALGMINPDTPAGTVGLSDAGFEKASALFDVPNFSNK